MKVVRAGAATILVGIMAACATQDQMGSSQSTEVNVSQDLTHRYGEVQVAVSPKNPKNLVYADVEGGVTYACQIEHRPECEIVVGKNDAIPIPMSQARGYYTKVSDFSTLGVFASFDGGKTWQRATIPLPPKDHPKLTGIGDPSVAVAPDGTFYLSFDNMDWGSPAHVLAAGGIGVSKSTDGGKTWSYPVLTGTPMDGPKMVADPNTGTLYANSSTTLGPLSTGNPDAPRGTISTRWIASSTDGVHWTKPQSSGGSASVSAAHGLVAAVFKTAGQASLFGGANNELCGSAPAPCVIFETSKDAGATWDRHFMPASAAAGSGGGPGSGPLVAADPSKVGHFAVALQTNGDKEFAVYETSDSGKTWSQPATFADDATKKHYHFWMNYSPNGVLGLAWRTMQPKDSAPPGPTLPAPKAAPPPGGLFDGPTAPYNIWAIISRDGGRTFSQPLQVSGGNSPAAQSGAGGAGDDYSSIVLDRDTAYIGWPDWRPGERQAFFRAIKLSEFKDQH